jgi:hypothetical protein
MKIDKPSSAVTKLVLKMKTTSLPMIEVVCTYSDRFWRRRYTIDTVMLPSRTNETAECATPAGLSALSCAIH